MFIGQYYTSYDFARGKDKKKRKSRKKKIGIAVGALAGAAALGGAAYAGRRKAFGAAKTGAAKAGSVVGKVKNTANNAGKIHAGKSFAKDKASNQAAILERRMYAGGATASGMKSASKSAAEKARSKAAALKQRRNLMNIK